MHYPQISVFNFLKDSSSAFNSHALSLLGGSGASPDSEGAGVRERGD